MTAVETTKPLRWSSARDCARKATYEATGAPARERTEKEIRTLYRGRSIGRDYLIFLATSTGKSIFVASGPSEWVPRGMLAASRQDAGIIAEQPVVWPLGIGHADAFIPETATIIEVLSSAHASDEMVQSKLLQACGYCEHYEGAENIALVIVNPADFSEDRVVVVKTSRAYADLLDEMHARLNQLAEWRDTGQPPARVCSKPSEARGHFCLHAEWCFEGWTPPAIEEVAADEKLIAAVAAFTAAKAAQSRAEKEASAHETLKKEAQKVIEAAELPAKRTVRVGPFEVTRTAVARSATFDWKSAESAGRFDPEALGEFLKPGAHFSTFKAERVDTSGSEYGEEAPW